MDIKSQVWAHNNKKVFVNDDNFENFSFDITRPLGDLGRAIGWNPSFNPNDPLGDFRPDRLLNTALSGVNAVLGTNLSALTPEMKQQRATEARTAVTSVWQLDPVKENDCTYLQDRLKQLGLEMDGFLAKNPSKTDLERTYNVMVEFETQYKRKIADLKCVEKADEAKKQADIQRITEEQKKAYEAGLPTTGLENKQTTPSTTSNVTKYILIGTGAVLLTIIGISALRK
jgi:hypothetical protein